MTTFAIFTPSDNTQKQAVRNAVERVFPGEFMELADGQFVASAEGKTSHEVSLLLDPTRGSIGRFIVIAIGGHHGWHRKDLWEWLSSRGTP